MKLADPSLLKNQCLVDGKWVGEGTRPIANPATGAVLAKTPRFGEAETIGAIEAAQRAFGPWAKTLPKERAKILRRWFDLIIANRDDIALIMTSEQGKPLAEALGEVDYAAGFVEFFGEEAKRIYGEVSPTFRADSRIVVVKQPIGVVGGDHAVEFPRGDDHPQGRARARRRLHRGGEAGRRDAADRARAWRIGRARRYPAWGPQPHHRRGARHRRGADRPSGRPRDRLHRLDRDRQAPDAQAAGTVKKVALELGGNAPFIVFDDADVDAAVEGAIVSKFRNMGQTCVCANRIYAQDGIYDAFVAKLTTAVSRLKVGDGTEAGVTQGPLINEAAVKKVEEHVADAQKKGAKVVVGGKRHALGRTFYEPTVIANVDSSMLVAREETFGPVAPVFRFKDEADVIAQANDTQFGLASYFYARDLGRVWRVAEALEYGMVGINTGAISSELAPFGGVKESGIGREGSRHGVEEFVEIKYMLMGGLDR